MAVKLADAIVEIQAEAQGLDQDFDRAEKKVFSFKDAMENVLGEVTGNILLDVGRAVFDMAKNIGGALIGVSQGHQQVFNQAQTQLGQYEEVSSRVADVARAAWVNNFGESMEEVGQATIDILQTMGDAAANLSDDELQGVVEKAIAIRDGFEIEVGESTRVVTQLMNTMGLTADEAFELIVAGQQQGLDRSEDWIDTLNEYSDDFAGLGLTADEVLTLMNQGLEAGAFNTDKIADGLNEFSIRLKDPAIGQAVSAIDDGLGDLFNQFAIGEITERDALTGMLDRLRAIEDPIARDQAGVQIFGSMWEDLGEEAFLALDLTTDELLTTAGALDLLNTQYDDLPTAIEGLKRRGLLALQPISDLILQIANSAMPFLEKAFTNLEAFLNSTLIPTFDILRGGITTFVLTLRGILTEAPPEEAFGPIAGAAFNAGQFILQTLVPAVQNFIAVMRDEVIPAVQPVVEQIIAQLVPGLIQLGTWIRDLALLAWPLLVQAGEFIIENFNIIGPIIAGVGAVILAITAPVAAVVAAVVLLATAWANNWGGIQEKAQAVSDWITGSMVPWFVEAFENIKGAVATAGAIWNEQFLPPIMAVWEFLNTSIFPLIRAIAGFMRAVFNLAFTAAAGIWQNVLQPALAAVREEIETRVQPVIEKLSEFFEKTIAPIIDKFANERLKNLHSSFSRIKDIIDEVRTFLKKLTGALEEVKLPAWMQPGSPSEWELSLMRTNDLLREMAGGRLPQLDAALQLSAPGSLALGGAGAGGGATTNVYGDINVQGGPLSTEADGRRGAENLVEGLRQEGEQ